MTPLLLATRNRGKLRELESLLREGGLESLTLETLANHPEVGEVEETAETFEENARHKARFAASATGLWALGEDSGLEVDALGGKPGVRSARFAGRHGDDAGNNERLLRELGSSPHRQARYVCVTALARPDGRIVATTRGTCEGRIAELPRGQGGFGYDPLFVPEGETRTMAELAPSEKSRISHRGWALRALVADLKCHLGGDPVPARRGA